MTTVYDHKSPTERLEILSGKLRALWAEILPSLAFVREIQAGPIDPALYARYMIETYHYTFHNARNQALVGVRAQGVSPRYTKFCFDHAEEETGHELMALHDVQSMGLLPEGARLPSPVRETEVLVAYLYWISAFGNPLQRLGYSFWAENAYEYILPLLAKIRGDLKLKDSQMTFFVAHSDIDQEHAEEVKRVILEHAKRPEDWVDIEQVMETSLRLTLAVTDGILRERANEKAQEKKSQLSPESESCF